MALNTSAPAVTPAFDQVAIRSHLSLLHNQANGVVGKFVLCAIFERGAGPITHHAVGDIEGMIAAVIAHEHTPNLNIYSGFSVMRSDLSRGKKGGEADVVAALGLVADMDADTGKIGLMPVPPSFVIETSPGNSQQVILFDKPMTPAEAKPFAVALQRATGADFGTADISHIWRIPGTLNWPTQKKIERGRSPEPFLVRLLEG